MKNPKISIVTVVFNAISSIEATILSVLEQSYSNIEYIIIDGCSSDGSLDVIKKYESKVAISISEPDKGIYDAMNKAKKIATGDFVFFLNCGDIFFSANTIKNIVDKMTEKDVLYYGDVFLMNIKKLYWGRFSKYKLAIGNICHQSIFYPRSIYKKYSYDLKYKVFADYYYNLSIYQIVKFSYLEETVCYYDNQGFSVIQKDEVFDNIVDTHIKRNLGFLPLLSRKIYWKLVFIKRKLIRRR